MQLFSKKLYSPNFKNLPKEVQYEQFMNMTENGLNDFIKSIVAAVDEHNYDGNVRIRLIICEMIIKLIMQG